MVLDNKIQKGDESMELKELAAKLVSFNTISSESSLPMANFICEYLDRCGFSIEQYPYVEKGVKKMNIMARKGGINSRLVYSGHMDTVPCGSGWDKENSPFSLVEKNIRGIGRVFQGLGIADMKLFLAIAMKVGEAIPENELKYPFALCFTSDEEVGCVGVKKLMKDLKRCGRPIGKYVVIGEPTELRPVYAHKGCISLEVIVDASKDEHGISEHKDNPCHSSNPNTTTNVVEKVLGPVIDELRKFQMSLEKVRDTRFNPPFPTMNIGGSILIGRVRRGEKMKFSDKVAKNIIPRGFVIEGDIRPVPGQDPQDLINIIRSNIKNRVAGIKTTVADEEIKTKVGCPTNKSPSYPMETPRNSAVVSLAEEVSGYPAETAAFNTEGNAFNKAGCEAIIWGPSDILQAHSDDEYVLAEFFNKETIEKYMLLLRRICT